MQVGLPYLSYLVPREEMTLGQAAAVLEEIGSCGHTVETLYVALEQGRSGYNQREPPLLLADARLKRLLSQRSPALDAFQHRRRCVLALTSLSASLHQYGISMGSVCAGRSDPIRGRNGENKNPPAEASGFFLAMECEKKGFAFLTDGFEPSESFSPIKGISVPPSDGNHKAGWKC